jgi:hypothetical protein
LAKQNLITSAAWEDDMSTDHEPINVQLDLEVEYEDSETSPEATGIIALWIDGEGYDISNSPRLDDRHGKTVWNNFHVQRAVMQVEAPHMVQKRLFAPEGQD